VAAKLKTMPPGLCLRFAQEQDAELIWALAEFEKRSQLEWSVLDWKSRAIALYKRLGAQPMSEWTVYRLAGSALQDFSRIS
jgi:hypothetical protein